MKLLLAALLSLAFALPSFARGPVVIPIPIPIPVPPGQDPFPREPQPMPPLTFTSSDGARAVVISGRFGDAYLHDTTRRPQFPPRLLSSQARWAAFHYDQFGRVSSVVVQVEEWHRGRRIVREDYFDAWGNPLPGRWQERRALTPPAW